ncbi:hypothetical protein [Erysipelothrix anatis]|uniref:hypothetical protein n=1 Tax=Erysipelothrix anatis TaxID=2683713 RepID=UPI00140C9D2D|nr:hypothetical protein [Erysipelothrix anatis]
MIKKVKNKRGFLIVLMMIGLILMCVVPINAEGETALDAVSHLHSMLELDNVFTAMALWIGNVLYKALAITTNMVENTFDVITRMNLFQLIPQLKIFQSNLNQMIATVFVIGLSGVVITRMIQRRETLSALYNVMMVGMMLVVFASVTGLIHEGKNAFLSFTKSAIRSDAKTSELIFVKNTYDMKYLVENANNGNKSIVSIHDQGFSSDKVKYLQFDERMSKDDLGYKYSLDPYTQELSGKRVNDGMFGYGDERYFRYHTDYALINITLLITVVVYLLAIIKGAFLAYDLVINELLGKIGVLKGLREIGDGARPMLSMVQTSVSLIVLTILVQLYSSISVSILSMSEQTLPWLVKMILLFVSGLLIVQGSDFLDTTFGFEGGRRTMITSFMASKASRSAKNMVRNGMYKTGQGIDAMNRFADGGKNKESSDNGGSNSKENSATDSSIEDSIDSPQNDMAQSKADSIPRPSKKKRQNIEDEVKRKQDGYKTKRRSDQPKSSELNNNHKVEPFKDTEAKRKRTNTGRRNKRHDDIQLNNENAKPEPTIPMMSDNEDLKPYNSKDFNEKVLDQFMKRGSDSDDSRVDSVPRQSKISEKHHVPKQSKPSVKTKGDGSAETKPQTPRVVRKEPEQTTKRKNYVNQDDVKRVKRDEGRNSVENLSNDERIKLAQERMQESLFKDDKK